MPPKPGVSFAHDILRRSGGSVLDSIFAPNSVAVVGATETPGKVGRTVVENLLKGGFAGTIYPINPKRPTILGLKAYPSVSALPAAPDLAVIITPPPTVPGIIAECVKIGTSGAIVISAGFKEIGPSGVELERQIMVEARKGQMRVVGPNCLGVMVPQNKFNATFAADMAKPGLGETKVRLLAAYVISLSPPVAAR